MSKNEDFQHVKKNNRLFNILRVLIDFNEYVKGDMEHYGLPGGPVHDATVIAYLLKPALFSGREVNVVVDSREGPTFGQTIVDWYDGLKQPKNAFWVENGDAQGFFDLLTERLGRLK